MEENASTLKFYLYIILAVDVSLNCAILISGKYLQPFLSYTAVLFAL